MHITDQLLGDLRPPGPAELRPVPYPYASPATGGLYRLVGDGWSWFCKVLQHARHWPMLSVMPPAAARSFAEDFPWRSELEMWDAPWVASMPDGLGVPVLHGVVDLGDDRLAVWMEDVRQGAGWTDPSCFTRAAFLLGRWNARCTDPDLLALSPYPAGHALRMYVERAVAQRGLGPLEDDVLWQHPWLREHADLRAALRAVGRRVPALLDGLDTHLQAMPHGDASPQNLLVPVEEPSTFVVIDVSFRSPHALGFDLGQLLVGLTHAGEIPAAGLPAIAEQIVPAYLDGLATEGVTGREEETRAAFAVSVLLRSGLDAVPYERLGTADAGAQHVVAERLAMSRFLVEQYDALAGGPRP